MSDLSATNCGCGCDSGMDRRGDGCFGNNSCLWIILLLCCCGGCGDGGFGGGNDSCLWIILLLFCCGGFGRHRDRDRDRDCGCGF